MTRLNNELLDAQKKLRHNHIIRCLITEWCDDKFISLWLCLDLVVKYVLGDQQDFTAVVQQHWKKGALTTDNGT